MTTLYLFETIYNLLHKEIEGNYEAQAVAAVDTLINNKNGFYSIFSDKHHEDLTDCIGQFRNLFESINSTYPLNETMKAVDCYIKSLSV